jgi:peptide/nickel transport system ATP-binding protein
LFRSLSAGERQGPDRSAARGEPLLRVQGVQLVTRGKPSARDKLNFELRRGASLALIGEIGSGRRALARALLGLDRVAGGRIVFDQVDIGVLNAAMMARLRRRVAFITGDDDALDPRMTIFDTVSEPLRAHLAMPRDLMAHNRDAALKRVGLAALPGSRTVASLSLFDRRRLQIARAIVSQPLLAVIDEPLRGLDAFAQSVVRDLLRNFRSNEGPALLVVTSDFGLARAFCEDGFVFNEGRVVERGPILTLLRAPQDPHTRKLLEAVAVLPAAPEPKKPSAGLAETAPPAPEA